MASRIHRLAGSLPSRFTLALFGIFGGLLPTVVALFRLVSTPDGLRPALLPLLQVDALIVTGVYLGCAGIVAAIFPYPRPSAWAATGVGAGLPTIIGAAAGAASHLSAASAAFRGSGGDETSWSASVLHILALF